MVPLKESMAPRASLSVPMPMVDIGDVRVIMDQRRVPVGVRVRLGYRPLMRVLMMLIVHMQMLVLDRLMDVQMLVSRAK